MKIDLALVMALTLITGCDNKPKVTPSPQPPQIIQDQKQALDNAKGVGDVIDKQGEEQRKKIEEATK